ncbi:MAG: amidohydrolase [Phycisphaerales bacterium]
MLREAHAHIVQHGRAMRMLRLDDCIDRDDCLQRVALAAADLAEAPPARWLLGVGLRVQAWPQPNYPTLDELDSILGPRPCCLWSFDHHALAANTRALGAAGFRHDSPDPPNGRLVRDSAGNLTGLALEAAAKAIYAAVPEPEGDERREVVRSALVDLSRHGFVEIHDLLSQPWLGPTLAALDDVGELRVRVWLYPPLDVLDAVASTRREWERPNVRLAGGKVFADGTLNSRTAWTLRPYADPLPGMLTGQCIADAPAIGRALARCHALGVGLAVHAIGDAAVRACLDAFESSPPSLRRAVEPPFPPLRIEHAEIIDAADVPRFARLGVVASVQPCHLLYDIEALRRGLPHRLDRVLPLRELIDAGCVPGTGLWFGSDTPIVRPDPADSIQAAVHRRRPGMTNGISAHQAITEGEARAAFAAG